MQVPHKTLDMWTINDTGRKKKRGEKKSLQQIVLGKQNSHIQNSVMLLSDIMNKS